MLHILGEALRGRWWFGEIFGNSSLYIGYVLGKILRDSEPRQRRHHTCVPFTGSWEGGCDSRLDISLFLVVRPPPPSPEARTNRNNCRWRHTFVLHIFLFSRLDEFVLPQLLLHQSTIVLRTYLAFKCLRIIHRIFREILSEYSQQRVSSGVSFTYEITMLKKWLNAIVVWCAAIF